MINPNTLKTEYLVQVQVIEARQIKGKDASGQSDAYVRITVADQPPQISRIAPRTNSAIWNQSFTFTGMKLADIDLENFEILIELMDRNDFLTNNLIGAYSIGLGILYRSKNHEFFNVWLGMISAETGAEVQAFLLVSCYIIGPNDNPPVHGINEIVYFEDDPDANLPDDELTPQQLRERRERVNRPGVLDNPNMNVRSYQLNINIAKVEDLPRINGTCDPFISVRCVGHLVTTHVVENTQKPVFNTRMQFPIVFPLMHDKIVVRIWDKNRFGADVFLARIPEKMEDNELFNIISLQSKGGTLPFRWINLYGIPGTERKSALAKLFSSKTTLVEGTEYMGRALISMTLSYAERPVKGVFPLPSFREPISQEYLLRVDVYELQEAEKCGDEIYVIAGVGLNVERSSRAKKARVKINGKREEIPRAYRWSSKKIMIEEIKVTYPVDLQQVPDIILSVYTSGFFGERRVSYIRIPPTNPKIQDDQAPQWYQLKSIENNVEDTEYGYLLANVVFKPESSFKGTRIPKSRDITIPYLMIAYVYGGYELGPELYTEDIGAKLEVRIAPEKPFGPAVKEGKFPIWNECLTKVVILDENLEFASKIIISVTNQKKASIVSSLRDNNLGSFTISALDCVEIKDLNQYEFGTPKFTPKFYHLTKDGFSKGRILASFVFVRNPKFENKDKYEQETKKKMKHKIKLETFKTRINFSAFGIRNLASPIKRPLITVIIRQKKEDKKEYYDMSAIVGYQPTKNLDILKLITLENVELTLDPLYLPVAEVIISEKDTSRRYFISLPLFEYSSEWRKPPELAEVQTLYYKGIYLDKEKRDKQPVEAEKKKEEEKKKTEGADGERKTQKLNATNLQQLKGEQERKTEGRKTKNENDLLGKIEQKSAEKEIPINKQQLERKTTERETVANKGERKTTEKEIPRNKKEMELDPEERDRLISERGRGSALLKKKKGDEGIEDNNTDFLSTTAPSMATEEEQLKPIMPNFRLEGILSLECTAEDKKLEDKERKAAIQEIKEKVKLLRNDPKANPEEISRLVQEAQQIEASKVDEVRFYGSDGKVGEDYDYGRPIQKEPMETVLDLPYLRYELNEMITLGRNFTSELNGFVRSGVPSGAVLKGALQIIPPIGGERMSTSTRKTNKSQYMTLGKKRKDLDPTHPFDIFDQDYLDYFKVQNKYKIRIYLLRGLNFSAQQDATELREVLAGKRALSSANSYPFIMVGDGRNKGLDELKQVNDKLNVIPQNLNPNFFKAYELDSMFPEDWQLQIQIYDHKPLWRDALIGSTTIDLEDRLIGHTYKKQMMSYEILISKWERELKEIEKKNDEDDKPKKVLQEKISKAATLMESNNKDYPAPVEYRALKNETKNTPQGSLEIFLEVLPAEIARSLPFAKIEPPKPEEFEMRLIIYGTFNVPRASNGVVDAYVRVTLLSSEGWTGEDINKDTDVHYGSTDGNGVFNWRMKFPLKVPSSFPRIKISVYDANVFGSDESIGTRALSLKRNIKKLMSEGRYVSPPGKIDLFHPNFKGETRGQVLISVNIISKSEAEAKPVGEAQEEPNRDPYLERPTEGRGVGDFLKGTAFGRFNLFGFFFRRILKYILGLVISTIITVILFVQPGILVNTGKSG